MITNWAQRTQAATQATATRHGEGWTSAELELLTAFADEAAVELAETLGRTLYAVQSMKQAVAAGKPVGSARKPARAYRGWMEGDGE